MIEEVVFSNVQGSGYICESKDAVETRPGSVELGGATLSPGTFSDLNGFFARPLEYLGLRDRTEMVFYIGSDEQVFKTLHYFQSVLWLSPTRFFEMFGYEHGRDFNFVNGVWK